MSIKKRYDVCCDICGRLIKTYHYYKPTTTQLRRDKINVIINNSKILNICQICKNKKQ